MKPKTVVILVLILVACAIYIVAAHTDLFKRAKPTDGEAADKRVFAEAPGPAVGLSITADRGTQITFAKRDGDWWIVKPIEARADRNAVADVVGIFRGLRYDKALAGDKEPADATTGLDRPLWTLTLTDEADKTYTLAIGNVVALREGESYVRAGDDDRALVIAMDFADRLDKTVGEFRDKTVLKLIQDEIAAVRVAGKESYELARTDDGWGLVKPVSAPAEKDKVDSLLGKLTDVQARQFVTDAPQSLAAYGLAAADARLVVTAWTVKKSEATPPATQPAERRVAHTLVLGNRAGDDIYARIEGRPAVFRLDGALLDDLQPKLADLRDKQVLRIDKDRIARIDLDLPTGKARLVKKDWQWRMEAPLAGKAGNDQVDDLLAKISDLKATAFHDGARSLQPYGLATPQGRITLLIGAKSPSGEMAFVKTAAGKAVADVAAAATDALLAPAAGYWDPVLLELPSGGKVSRLALKRPDATYLLVRGPDDAWSLTAPLAAEADDERVNAVLDSLEKLKADRIVALGAKVPATYAAAKDRIAMTVTVTLPAPATRPTTAPTTGEATTRPKPVVKTYRVGVARIGDDAFAWVAGGKTVAVGKFAKGLYDKLAAELRDRTVADITPGDVTGVKISAAGKIVCDLRKQKDKWAAAGDPAVPIDAEKVKTFLKDLSEIKAEKFVTHAAANAATAAKYGLDKPDRVVELTLPKGPVLRLSVSAKLADAKTEARYAAVAKPVGVFTLAADDAKKLAKSLKDFKK